MPTRKQLVAQLVSLIGPAATLVDVRSGWPSLIDLALDDTRTVRLAAHVSQITDFTRQGGGVQPLEQRPKELRFQNPQGKPGMTSEPPGTMGLLIGVLPSIDGDRQALVVAESLRLGNATRFSVLFPGSLAYEASRSGWSSYVSKSNERMWGLSPPLLPALVDALRRDVEIPATLARTAVQAAGGLEQDDTAAKERTRVAGTRLVRDATFRERVIDAYGRECVFCGLGVNELLHAAHLLPVGLPDSTDDESNGIPACLSHHALFDSHSMHVDPATLLVSIHPAVVDAAQTDPALAALVATTRTQMTASLKVSPAEVHDWLVQRYLAYPDSYRWL